MDIDLLNVDPIEQESQHKLKRLVQSPNSYFMDIKCPKCKNVSVWFSNGQTELRCPQ